MDRFSGTLLEASLNEFFIRSIEASQSLAFSLSLNSGQISSVVKSLNGWDLVTDRQKSDQTPGASRMLCSAS